MNPQESPELPNIQRDPQIVASLRLNRLHIDEELRPELQSFAWLDDHVEEPERWDGLS